MNVYVINLDSATNRWSHMTQEFAAAGFAIQRVAAVDGASLQLPCSRYAEGQFHYLHGRGTNLREIGCYFSHLQAWSQFLESAESHALICEDDLQLAPNFRQIIGDCLQEEESWDIVRLSALRQPPGLRVRRLPLQHELWVALARLKGAGAYLINRLAARRLLAGLETMRVPLDHALDREWFFGLRATMLIPFPVSQTEVRFRSSIQGHSTRRLSWRYRVLGTYPYQAFNELSRYVARFWQYLRTRGPLPAGTAG